jgi:hypothetical protein
MTPARVEKADVNSLRDDLAEMIMPFSSWRVYKEIDGVFGIV